MVVLLLNLLILNDFQVLFFLFDEVLLFKLRLSDSMTFLILMIPKRFFGTKVLLASRALYQSSWASFITWAINPSMMLGSYMLPSCLSASKCRRAARESTLIAVWWSFHTFLLISLINIIAINEVIYCKVTSFKTSSFTDRRIHIVSTWSEDYWRSSKGWLTI